MTHASLDIIGRLEEENARLEADNLRLSGEIHTLREELASYKTAEAIAEETRFKRQQDGMGD